MRRILWFGGGGLCAAVVVALVLVFTNLGATIKDAVEGYGSQATGTRVTLREAAVSIFGGDGALRELVIGNPDGFSTPHAFRLGEISVRIDPISVIGNTSSSTRSSSRRRRSLTKSAPAETTSTVSAQTSMPT